MNDVSPARNVLVVIGSGGMGVAAVRRLGGGRRVLLADNSASRLQAAVTTLESEGHAVDGLEVDVSDRGSVESLAAAGGRAGLIEAILHTAGVSPVTASAQQIYHVDLLGTAHVIDAFLPVAAPGTSLVCIASMAGHFASLPADFERHLAGAPSDQLLSHPGIDLDATDSGTAYVVAKRGNQLRVQAAAHVWGRRGARLNTVSPGVISTPMGVAELDGPMGAYMRAMIDSSGVRRVGTADDIAGVVDFLVGPGASFITGTDILVDGGVVATQQWNSSPPT